MDRSWFGFKTTEVYQPKHRNRLRIKLEELVHMRQPLDKSNGKEDDMEERVAFQCFFMSPRLLTIQRKPNNTQTNLSHCRCYCFGARGELSGFADILRVYYVGECGCLCCGAVGAGWICFVQEGLDVEDWDHSRATEKEGNGCKNSIDGWDTRLVWVLLGFLWMLNSLGLW